MTKISDEKILAYALKNAIEHEGKAIEGPVISSLFAEGLEKTEIKEYIQKIRSTIEKVNSYNKEKQKEEYQKYENLISRRQTRTGLPDLPNAIEEKVVMRLAPYPSGPLHIGNARTAILNDEYVKKYKGKLYLVIDDTIGSAEKPIEKDAYELIKEGVDWLGIKYEKIIYKSDRNEIYYKYAEDLIKKGHFYVCNCKEDWKRYKENLIDCPCRNLSPETHLKRWKEMFSADEGELCVRVKTSMNDKDPAFRDRVMLKISKREHPRTKDRYQVYPSMEFSWAIDDHLLQVTHILRGIDQQISTRVQNYIRDILGWKNPESLYNGFLAIEGAKISKSKGSKEVKSGKYIGWNDPRTWSLQSLRDRGIKPEAIRNFIVNLGLNKGNIKVPVDVLYSENRKIIENSKRYQIIEDPIKIKIKGCPPLDAKIPLRPTLSGEFKEYKTSQEFLISKREFDSLKEGNYRLLHLLNFKVTETKNYSPKEFSFISTAPEKELKVQYLNWLPANQENVKVLIRDVQGKLKEYLGEPALKELSVGEIVQFERFGYACLYKKEKDYMEFWYAHE